MAEEPDVVEKIVILGASDVGKSSLVLRYVKGKFFDRRENTIGAAFLSKIVTINDVRIKYEMWDTAGQERYHSLAPMYYRDAAGALIVFDITDSESFVRSQHWLNELYKAGRKEMAIFLVGNKLDLEENRKVSHFDANQFASKQNLPYFETSAKTGDNIESLFEELGKKLLENKPVAPRAPKQVVQPQRAPPPPEEGKCC